MFTPVFELVPPDVTPIGVWVDRIWIATPKLGRKRSSRAEVEVKLKAALNRKADPAQVLRGIQAAYADETYAGDKALGVHRLIEHDRWREWAQDGRPERPKDTRTPEEQAAAQAEYHRHLIELRDGEEHARA